MAWRPAAAASWILSHACTPAQRRARLWLWVCAAAACTAASRHRHLRDLHAYTPPWQGTGSAHLLGRASRAGHRVPAAYSRSCLEGMAMMPPCPPASCPARPVHCTPPCCMHASMHAGVLPRESHAEVVGRAAGELVGALARVAMPAGTTSPSPPLWDVFKVSSRCAMLCHAMPCRSTTCSHTAGVGWRMSHAMEVELPVRVAYRWMHACAITLPHHACIRLDMDASPILDCICPAITPLQAVVHNTTH